MKFGQNLPRNQVPEWAAAYIHYKTLKKLIKAAAHSNNEGDAPDLAGETGTARHLIKPLMKCRILFLPG